MAKRRGHGDGSIFKDGTRWVAVITVASAKGHQVRRKRSARTYAEARTKLRELQKELEAGVSSTRATVAGYMDSWLALQRATDKSPNTVANYDWAIRNHIVPALGHLRLADLRADDVDRLLLALAEKGKARNTTMRVRAVLSMALREAERRGLVMKNVAALTTTPAGPRREGRSLTMEQARALLDAAKGDRLEAAWTTMLLLGLRPGELCGLGWEDVDLDAGLLHVRHARLQEPGGARLGEPKTRRSVRSLEMPDPLTAQLHRQLVRQAEERVVAGTYWQENGLVFTSTVGTPIDRWALRRRFATLTEDAGLGSWHPTDLRHSAVSLLSAAGVPLEQIADVTGHSSTRMTGDVYRHAVRPTVSAAKRPMERLFGTPETKDHTLAAPRATLAPGLAPTPGPARHHQTENTA